MDNHGVISIIIGLLIIVLKHIPDWIVWIVGLLIIVYGLFAIFNPKKADELTEKFKTGEEE